MFDNGKGLQTGQGKIASEQINYLMDKKKYLTSANLCNKPELKLSPIFWRISCRLSKIISFCIFQLKNELTEAHTEHKV